MRHFFALLFFIVASIAGYGQNTEAQNQTLINSVRNSTPNSAKIANALDAVNYSKQGILQAFTASGTDTYTVTVNTGITALADGVMIPVKFTNANTSTTVTLNPNSIGATAIKDNEGNDLAVGDIKAGGTYWLRHNGTHFRVVGATGGGGGGGASISDAAFSSSWNGNTTDGASKNALYDKIVNTGGRIFNVESYGALHDYQTVSTASISSGTDALTTSGSVFTASDVGKTIRLSGAGAAGVDLITTIDGYTSGTSVSIATNASTTISAKRIEWGSDDTQEIQAAINAAFTNGGGTVYFPNGLYLIGGSLVTSVDAVNPNCQIYIPLSNTSTNLPFIQLVGESTPMLPRGPFAAADEPTTGVILKSIIVGTGTLPSVIGSSFANDGFVDANKTVVSIDKITIRTTSIVGVNHTTGTMTAFKLHYLAAKPIVKNSQAYIESTPTLSVAQSVETYGFYLDGHSRSDHGSYYENLIAVGYNSGFRVEEHSVSPRLTSVACVYGITVGGSGGAVHPIILGPFSAFWCNYAIRVVSNITADITFYAENWPGSFTTAWYDRIAEVYIPSTVEINGVWRGSAYNAGTGTNVDPTISGSYTGNFTLEKRENMPRKSYSSTFETSNIISASNGGYNATNSTSGGEVGYYTENNRGGGASYGYMLYGGSTNAIGTIFGVSRADKMFVVADGASNLGMGLGTYTNQPLYIGTNNTARLTFSGSAATGRTTFNNAAEYTEFQTTGVEGIRLVGSNATRSTIYSQATSAGSQSTIYLENNRGSFASYGGFLYGGSTNSTGNIFGVSRADKLFIFADGASSLGMGIGTLTADPVYFGVNNAEVARLASTGEMGVGVTSPTSRLHTTSFATAYAAKTALYTLTAADYTIEVTSGTHTQTLPTAVGITGRQYVITNSGSGTVTVGTNSSQTFANVTGTPTTLGLAQFKFVMVQSNGANWLVISQN